MVVGSFLTFVGITYYVSDKVTVKSTMVQVKGMTTYERLVLFVLICYSPLVQNAAVMRRCITDPDLGWVLEADPRVSCEESSLRTAVAVHGIAVIVIMGVGLPYFVLQTMYNLRGYGKLSESNIYVALYEWYSPARPYWEAVLLAKKFVLIMASTTVIKDPLAQALIGTATNLAYLVLFELKRPMLMQPSRLLRGKNLFHMIERAASIASLIGSIIAVLGAASPGIVGVLGVLFALCNLAYATYVVGFFLFEEKKTKNLNQVAPDEKVWFGMSAWNSHAKLIDEMDLAPADREQMVGEMMLLRTKVLAAMEKELGAATGEAEEVMAQVNAALAKIRADTLRLEGGTDNIPADSDGVKYRARVKSKWRNVEIATVPASVTRLGEGDFAGCNHLKGVELHEGVTEIGKLAFANSSLTKMSIPASVKRVGEQVFAGCTALLTVELHDGVTEIGEAAFQKCSSLTELKIPASVSKLDAGMFEGCTALLTVELHDGVTEIGEAAFKDCSSLTELNIPASVRRLGERLFQSCTALRVVELHEGVTEIGKAAFGNCTSLTEITIPASVRRLGENVFQGCTALRVVELHEGVTEIGELAFVNCASLTEITIPASVRRLGENVFQGCTALRVVELHEGVTEIGKFAFVNCTSLTKMSIPASVKRVGEQVFAGCTALLTVELHDGVTKIGLGAFLNCSSLAELKIPASVSKLDSGMFFGCTALRTVELHDGVKEIGWRAFYNCNSLTEIKAALGTKIDDNAFHGCTALEAKAKAEGFSSVNKFVVERSMPETWAMRKGAEAGNLEQPASVAGGAAAGADEGKGRGDVGVAADPAALLEPVSGKPGERGEGDVDAAGNKDEAVCCNCGGSGRTKYPRFIDMCLGDETMIKEENVRTNTLHVEQGLWLLLCFGFLTGLWFGLWYLICVVAAGGSIAWPHGLSSPLYLVSFYGFSTLIDPKMSLLNHKQPNKPTALVMSHSPMQRDPMYPK
ncbi:hypothetical protein TeGR_g10326 [Tetraparma gracilis]|uniref:Uncharacterized protein n=1 Tax=Tetraparma gracilis TaxID=2962635 RepID=A0ABQ6MZJ9_9STRA|nr:hypothetical protein TeGR_g10326 [Tetraparma gracilis]